MFIQTKCSCVSWRSLLLHELLPFCAIHSSVVVRKLRAVGKLLPRSSSCRRQVYALCSRCRGGGCSEGIVPRRGSTSSHCRIGCIHVGYCHTMADDNSLRFRHANIGICVHSRGSHPGMHVSGVHRTTRGSRRGGHSWCGTPLWHARMLLAW